MTAVYINPLGETEYSLVTYRDSWIATEQFCEDNYSGGYFDCRSNPETFHALDGTILALNVPLCSGCDQPIDAGVCHDCQIVFAEGVGDPFLKARAA